MKLKVIIKCYLLREFLVLVIQIRFYFKALPGKISSYFRIPISLVDKHLPCAYFAASFLFLNLSFENLPFLLTTRHSFASFITRRKDVHHF